MDCIRPSPAESPSHDPRKRQESLNLVAWAEATARPLSASVATTARMILRLRFMTSLSSEVVRRTPQVPCLRVRKALSGIQTKVVAIPLAVDFPGHTTISQSSRPPKSTRGPTGTSSLSCARLGVEAVMGEISPSLVTPCKKRAGWPRTTPL